MFETQDAAAAANTDVQLDRFLASVERRAYQMALLGCGHREDALDIVQDSMFKLVKKYRDKPSEQWKPLFYRILQSTLNDWYRRKYVRNKWSGWFGGGRAQGQDDDPGAEDLMQQASDVDAASIAELLDNDKAMQALQAHVAALPMRQQQTFILRAWEGMNVEQTAEIMGCGQGSIKTHYSRAVNSLRKSLEEFL